MNIEIQDIESLSNFEKCIRFAVKRKNASKIVGFICVHNITLGPALGGLRINNYGSEAEALIDCSKLARGMSYKNAASGLPLGGGKAVINIRKEEIIEDILHAFAKVVHKLRGTYITAPDMNTTSQMMDIIYEKTPYVACLSPENGGLGDPSVWTAEGVFLSMKTAVKKVFGRELRGKDILIEGYGKVGSYLAHKCMGAGMRVTIYDTDRERVKKAVNLGCRDYIRYSDSYGKEYDIFSPNAVGGTLSSERIKELSQCGVRLIVGGANNQRANEIHIREFNKQGILWIPDFIANSGGVAEACADWRMRNENLTREQALKLLEDKMATIAGRVEHIIQISQGRGMDILEASKRLAERTVADQGGELR